MFIRFLLAAKEILIILSAVKFIRIICIYGRYKFPRLSLTSSANKVAEEVGSDFTQISSHHVLSI